MTIQTEPVVVGECQPAMTIGDARGEPDEVADRDRGGGARAGPAGGSR